MLGYEWKKIRQSPVALLVAAILILIKLAALIIQVSSVEYETRDKLIDELYKDLTITEVERRIGTDYANAEAELARSNEVVEAYVNGEISIEELREWDNGAEERFSVDIALEGLMHRVEELMTLQERYEDALNGTSSDAADAYIARWKPIRLVHEQVWKISEMLEELSYGGYWVLLLLIPVFSEMWDTRMDVLVRSSGNGWKMVCRAKILLTATITLIFWALECFIDYGLPGMIQGYGAFDTAIQSIPSCAGMILPWSIGEYLAACCLLRLLGYLTMYTVTVVMCRFIRSVWRSFAVCAGIYMLMDVLDLWKGFTDKLLSPGSFFRGNTAPDDVIAICVGYCIVVIISVVLTKRTESGKRRRLPFSG